MQAIHQLIAGFASGDAISNAAQVLGALFRSWGFPSEIFSAAGCIAPDLRTTGHDAAQLPARVRPDDLVILHLSIGSPVNDIFAELPCRRAIIYHNITPDKYFRGINESMARDLAWGREQARRLVGSASVVLADSHYNARELEAMGYGSVRTIPLLLDFQRLRAQPDRSRLRQWSSGQTNILFVGRCAPNKRFEDLLHAFYYYQKFVEPNSRLLLAGSYVGLEKYKMLLLALAHNLGLHQVIFSGAVSQAELNAHYAAAHLFLCLSEHEGFCIPLLESMVHRVPVLAYGAAAVPETLDGAGVLIHAKRWDWLAEMMGQLTRPTPLRQAVLAAQDQRLRRYEQRNLAEELRQGLAPLLSRQLR